jgi:hypothetical protein
MSLLAGALIAIYIFWSDAVLEAIGRAHAFATPPFPARQALLAIGAVMLVAAHESGHWVAGEAVGWRGLRFRIGPLGLERASNGWRIRWIKWDLGGGVVFAPHSLMGYRRADTIFTAGGPAASALFAAACCGVAWFATNRMVFWLFATMAQWSWLGVLSLVPLRKGLASSDGYWLWQLMRGGPDLDRRKRYMLANMSHGTDLRPSDWPRELMGPVIDDIPGRDRHEDYLAYVHFMDLGDPDAAFLRLAAVLEKWQKSDPPEYALEAAYYAGVYSADSLLAARWLECAGNGADRWVRLRAEAAVALAEGRTGEARRLAEEALARLEDVPHSGYGDYEMARAIGVLHRTVDYVLEARAPATQIRAPGVYI